MKRTIEHPVVTGVLNEEVSRHPAYGQVSFNHVSGSANLYGSDFVHQHYVMLTIKTSELHRDLSSDWHFEKQNLIEVALSEAQYATLISAPNRSGVPCTILWRETTGIVPGLPNRDNSKLFSQEHLENLQNTVRALKLQREEIVGATSKLSKKQQANVLGPLDAAIREIESNLPFLVKSFDEHMETTVEKAKIEVNAYVTETVHRAGLDAIQGKNKPLIIYDPEK